MATPANASVDADGLLHSVPGKGDTGGRDRRRQHRRDKEAAKVLLDDLAGRSQRAGLYRSGNAELEMSYQEGVAARDAMTLREDVNLAANRTLKGVFSPFGQPYRPFDGGNPILDLSHGRHSSQDDTVTTQQQKQQQQPQQQRQPQKHGSGENHGAHGAHNTRGGWGAGDAGAATKGKMKSKEIGPRREDVLRTAEPVLEDIMQP